MRFKIWLGVVAVLPIFILAGCGGSGSNSAPGKPTLQTITVTGGASSVAIGGTTRFSATGHYSDGSMRGLGSGLVWSSSATSVVTINSSGLATGVATGVATITATLGGTSGKASLGVNNALVGLSVSGASSIAYQQSLQLTANGTYQAGQVQNLTSSVTWKSSSPAVVSVSPTGIAMGLKSGSATITATDPSSKLSGTAALAVAVTLSSIAITPGSLNVNYAPGLTKQFTATGTYQDGSTQDVTSAVSWSSSTPGVAAISGGSASVLKGGQTTLSASSGSISASASLTVTALLTGMNMNPSSASVDPTASQQFTVSGTYNDGSTQDLTSTANWTSSNTLVASVSPAGIASGQTSGTANIKASFGGQFSQGTLAVNSPSAISVTPNNSSVIIGKTLQFKAVANYSDGFEQEITALASWSTQPTSVATVNSTGLVTGVAKGTATVKASYGLNYGQTTLSVTGAPQAVSMAITPIGPAVLVGGKQQFTAIATFSDGSTQDLTASSTWSSSDVSKVSIASGGSATGVAPGAVTITATSGAISGSTAINVVSSACPPLKGDYAFTLVSADERGPAYYYGSFHADGSGHITSGIEDANTSSGVVTDVAVSGSYIMYPDGRGTITLSPNAAHPSGISLRYIVPFSASSARLMEFDGNGTAKGTLELQAASAASTSSINGTYVFRMGGSDANGKALGEIGVVTADGSGHITSGDLDTNDFGTVTAGASLSPSSYLVGSNGRGTMTIGSSNFAVYVVDSSKFNLIQIDQGTSAIAGVAELQANQSFTNASLKGGYAFLLQQPVVAGGAGGGLDRAEFNEIGQWNFDGTGSMIGIEDDDNNYANNPITGLTGSYCVGKLNKINGRATITISSSFGNRSYIMYLISPSRMYMLETYLGATTASTNAPIGVAELQSGSGGFSQVTLTGRYALSASELTEHYSETLMQLVFTGSGSVSGIADLSLNGNLSAVVMDAVYNGTVDQNTGRATIAVSNGVGANNYVFYLIDNTRTWLLGVTPDSDGNIELQ